MRVVDDHLIIVVRNDGQTQTLRMSQPSMHATLEEANVQPSSGPEFSMGSLGECHRRGLTRFGVPYFWNSPDFLPATLGRTPVLFDRGHTVGPSFHSFRTFQDAQNPENTVFMVKAVHPFPATFAPLPPEGENIVVGSWFVKIWYDEDSHCLKSKVAKFRLGSTESPPMWDQTDSRPISWIVNPFLVLADIWRGTIYVREESAMHGELRALEFVDPL